MKAITLALALAAAALPVSAGARVHVFKTTLTGPAEVPPNASPGTGAARLEWDDAAHTAALAMTWGGLLGTTTASHIHAATAVPGAGAAGVATQVPRFVGFPVGVTAGSYSNTFATDAASFYNPAFVAAQGGVANAESLLLASLIDGRAYLNIHSTFAPGGEIRGFFAAVPEPGAWTLAIGGFALAGLALRRRPAARA
jgi:hypothetical protein